MLMVKSGAIRFAIAPYELDIVMLKINESKGYSQLEYENKTSSHGCVYSDMSVDEFFCALNMPSGFVFSECFKRRLHKLSIDGVVRPNGLCAELKREVSGGKTKLKKRGYLKCLNPFKIKHDHVDAYEEQFIHNINNHLKRHKIKLSSCVSSLDFVMSEFMEKYRQSRTGHWVIYLEIDNKKIFLDVCRHGDDEYLCKDGLSAYKNEFPELFI